MSTEMVAHLTQWHIDMQKNDDYEDIFLVHRIPMIDLRKMTQLDIDGDLYYRIVNYFNRYIPLEITPQMIENTLLNIDCEQNAFNQYIHAHKIDIAKRMRSMRTVYNILRALHARGTNNTLMMNKRYCPKYEKIVNMFHPILYYMCYTMTGDYCAS